jgi:hypothetical protein
VLHGGRVLVVDGVVVVEVVLVMVVLVDVVLGVVVLGDVVLGVVVVVVTLLLPRSYSIRSQGALSALASYAVATLWPLPVMMRTSALPLAQPARFTISWMTPARSGVRSAGPATPSVAHDGGDQGTAAPVRGRVETLPEALVKVTAWSLACPSMMSAVGSEVGSSTWNCTYAFRIAAPRGTGIPLKRSPTV